METIDFILLTGPLCGVLMVLGGILLLYKGSLSLDKAGEEGAFSLEFKRELRLTTHYPALGFFLIGALFVVIPFFFAQQERELTVKARAVGVNQPVKIELEAGKWSGRFPFSPAGSEVNVEETFRPRIDHVKIVITAPGYEPHTETFHLDKPGTDEIDLGEVELIKVADRAAVEGTIHPLPAGAADPPADGAEPSTATFGVAQ